MKTVLVTIKAPRTLRVRVPAGRTDRETLMAAATKAQRHIILTASLRAA